MSKTFLQGPNGIDESMSPCQIIRLPAWEFRRTNYSPLVYQVDQGRSSIIDLPFAVNSFYIEVVNTYTVAYMSSATGFISKVSYNLYYQSD